MNLNLRRLSSAVLALSFVASSWAAPQATPAPMPPRPKGVGLVLGGGGARGLAHLGVLEELERLRIPVQCIAGTSAGSLVGGAYAAGLPLDQVIKEVEAADWDRMLTGSPLRKGVPYTRKKDDYKNLADVTLGVDKNGLKIPRAAVSSQDIDMFLRRMTHDISVANFDDLPIPFQAVATDLITGEPVEFKGGDLTTALRASMAVPGAFDLVEEDGRLLVDGMLVRNVPVQNVKGRCADDVIVVDVGTPLLKVDEIHSFLDVAAQQSNIFVRLNVREQLAKMGPGDVLIQPVLDGYSSASFADAKAIIQRGRESVAPIAAQLERFRVSEAEYAAWRQQLVARAPEQLKPYSDVTVAASGFIPEKRIEQFVKDVGDKPTNQTELLTKIDQLYATGDFDRIAYSLRDRDGQRVAEVTPFERTVGPNYLRFGLDFKIDTYGTSDVAFLGNLQFTWLNRWGAQWRNDVRIGKESYAQTEFYQPLGMTPFFASASASVGSTRYDLFLEDQQIATLQLDTRGSDFGLGYALGPLGEVRLSYFTGSTQPQLVVGPPINDATSKRFSGVRLYGIIDQFDNPRFPRSGYLTRLDYHNGSIPDHGHQSTLDFTADGANSSRSAFTLRGTVHVEGNVGQDQVLTSVHTLGGFLKLSGLNTDELVGERSALARVMAYQRVASIFPTLGTGMYVGGSLEVGKVWNPLLNNRYTNPVTAGSLFLGIDTVLGPLYTAYGQAEGGRRAAYLYLGVDY